MTIDRNALPQSAIGQAIDLTLMAHALQAASDAARGAERAGLTFKAEQVRERVRTALADMDAK